MMPENVKVSVIVPIYHVEQYISRCVRSIMLQDYKNIEIILVDAGSPDHCGKIIDELAETDDRIIVIHQNNRGVSSARNAGLRKSTGHYVMFVDGDDWVETDYVSYFLKLTDNGRFQVAMNKHFYDDRTSKSTDLRYTVSSEKATEWIYSGEMFVAVWNKIYSRSFLQEHQILFNEEIWYGEGMLFNIECLSKTDEVAIGEKSVYHQTNNPNSAMRKFNLESNLCGIRSLELQKQLWNKSTRAIEMEWLYHRYRFNKTIIDGLIRSDTKKEHLDIYKECLRNIRSDILLPIKMEKRLKAKIWWICYAVCPSVLAKRHTCIQSRK